MSSPNLPAPLTHEQLETIAKLFKTLAEPMRLRILQTVCKDERSVGAIVEASGSTQANVSKHLALLTSAGILRRRKDGQRVFYGVKDELAVKLCELVRAHIGNKSRA